MLVRKQGFDKEEWFWPFKSFWKLKTSWFKFKISMARVYKKHEVKTKMVQDHWLQLKTKFSLGYNKNVI